MSAETIRAGEYFCTVVDARSPPPIGEWPQKRPWASSLSSADDRFGSCITVRHAEGLGASDMGTPPFWLFPEFLFLLIYEHTHQLPAQVFRNPPFPIPLSQSELWHGLSCAHPAFPTVFPVLSRTPLELTQRRTGAFPIHLPPS